MTGHFQVGDKLHSAWGPLMKIELNQRDADRLKAVAEHRGMTSEECAVGLIQQSLRKWEAEIRHQNSPKVMNMPY